MTYSEIEPPEPPVASFSNDRFAAFEAVILLYMPMLGIGNFFRGSTCSSVVLLLPFSPLSIPPPLVCRLPRKYSNRIAVNFE